MKNKTYGTFNQAKNTVEILKQSDEVIIDFENQLLSETDMIKKMISRFPHLAKSVFKELAIDDLQTCLNVSRKWCNFIQNEKFPWEKKIQSVKNICKKSKNSENHEKMFKKAPLKILQDLCFAIQKSTQINIQNEFSPLHIGAEIGMLDLCKFIMFKTDNKNPKDEKGVTALHFAAQNGHFEVCKTIFGQIIDKNPVNTDGDTPLHFAAKNGHLKLCKYLAENGMDKNLRNRLGKTPFDLAFEKCQQWKTVLFVYLPLGISPFLMILFINTGNWRFMVMLFFSFLVGIIAALRNLCQLNFLE